LAAFNARGLVWKRIEEAAEGLSHSEVTIATEQAAKIAILSKAGRVTTEALVAALTERRHSTMH
jgi:hypothetical protein